MSAQIPMRQVLLAQSDPLARRTAAATAAAMGVAHVTEADSLAAAERALRSGAFAAVVIDSADTAASDRLVSALRAGRLHTAADTPVLLICPAGSAGLDALPPGVTTTAGPLSVRTLLLQIHGLVSRPPARVAAGPLRETAHAR